MVTWHTSGQLCQSAEEILVLPPSSSPLYKTIENSWLEQHVYAKNKLETMASQSFEQNDGTRVLEMEPRG